MIATPVTPTLPPWLVSFLSLEDETVISIITPASSFDDAAAKAKSILLMPDGFEIQLIRQIQ